MSALRPLALGLMLALPALPAAADQITVFAAASLKNAMDKIAPAFAEATGHEATVALAGSSALARQIQQGAPADVFISANESWMDTLEDEGLLTEGTRTDLLENAIVLIGHGAGADPVEITPALDLTALLDGGRLAMALVDAVPAGIYGKASLDHLGLWDGVAPSVAQADNVRAALALVSTGEAPMGIVYATDAAADPEVSVLGTFPADSHPPIVYPAATLGAGSEAAQAFLDYLKGPEAEAVFTALGFTTAGD
ncbi:molybdate ABC transporter substrate-binding protein [Maritimibacter alkaliphilus]|uniref:molybdate ABC transporter substrate-binding protein n=1 Tax=Maritimibacter alkaliphilus TaxID=404236 RepID=UPI001C968269|nr:molybdate ABC transporter substrate-binding protein [Maritimibacter alkaliphilus]MBY6091129.1 molybdate ABC transporter substrate-binding protein [Maritimibacter alkaliphilus]